MWSALLLTQVWYSTVTHSHTTEWIWRFTGNADEDKIEAKCLSISHLRLPVNQTLTSHSGVSLRHASPRQGATLADKCTPTPSCNPPCVTALPAPASSGL